MRPHNDVRRPGSTLPARLFLRLSPALLIAAVAPGAAAPAYDPLAEDAAPRPAPLDLTIHDTARSRDIPIRVYLPPDLAPQPVVLFSHGLGGSRSACSYLGEHWAARGYVAVFLQHPGSDESVWKDLPPAKRMTAMRRAANLRNFVLRAEDIPAVLDQLARWNETPGHVLAGRLDLRHVGMSGHSFGAVTTQAVSGQQYPGGKRSFTDPRVRAAIAFSPSSPRGGAGAETAFGRVAIPWMLMTGTRDVAPIGGTDVASRLAVFPALPPGNKYELVLDGAEHSAFTDRPLPGEAGNRNPNHHRAILALSTAFWDAYLRDEPAAKAWLDGNGPRSVLEKNDRWQEK